MRHFTMMLIHQKCQSMCKRKAGKISCVKKANADPDEIHISDDSDLEDNDNIETIEEENPQLSFPAALQMLNQLQDFASSYADTAMQCHLPLLLKSYKT